MRVVRAAASATDESLDAGRVARLREVPAREGGDAFQVIARMYLRDAPQHVAAVQEAAGRADADAVRGAAHTLRGGSANLGAARVAALCEEIEQRARDGAVPPPDLVQRLVDEFAAVQGLLATELEQT